jgi:hypothetical protein
MLQPAVTSAIAVTITSAVAIASATAATVTSAITFGLVIICTSPKKWAELMRLPGYSFFWSTSPRQHHPLALCCHSHFCRCCRLFRRHLPLALRLQLPLSSPLLLPEDSSLFAQPEIKIWEELTCLPGSSLLFLHLPCDRIILQPIVEDETKIEGQRRCG